MSNLTVGRGASISQYLRATQEIPQGVIFGAKYASGPNICRSGGLTFGHTGF